MEYTLEPSADGDYIEVIVSGDISRSEAGQLTADHFELGEKLGIRCFLIDVTRARNRVRVLDNVQYTLNDVPYLEPEGVKSCAAVLVDPVDHSHDFQVAFAQSHGIDITMFWSRSEAIEHLKKHAPSLNRPPANM